MREKKIKLAFFTVPEWEKEEKWLRKQHKAGWKLVNASLPGFYSFEKCEPEDVVYQLDYSPEGMENKSEYVQMFADCGWEYITDMVGYSYFRKPVSQMNGEEEIFSDDASKLDMIERVFKGRMIPMLVCFFLIIIPQLNMQMHMNNPFSIAFFWIYAVMFIFYLFIFIKFYNCYNKLKKRLKR